MNTDPFNVTGGLGTYFNEITFTGTQNQRAYYTLIDPQAQVPIHLSTPYVNTVVGTGIPGTISSSSVAAARIGYIAGQPASDSAYNLYIGTNYNGWRLQRITPSGRITTLAGNNQYFYGDGQFPLSAALGPRLAVSVYTPGTILITDISNSRIRYVTSDPIITTIAGTGVESYTGDSGLAFNATFSTPTTTVTDSLGTVYIADTGNHVIRRIQNSTINTYAGTGQIGNTGDDGPAISATLVSPYGVTVDSANNLLFTDLSACAIRRITSDGIIRRVAGTYTQGFSGDGGPASNAALSLPRDIAVDSANNIYFCDTGNSRVRRIDAATNIILTVAGNGVSGYGGDNGPAALANLSSPTGIAVDTAGNLYIADTNNQCIRYVNMTTSTITTVAGRPRIAGFGGDRSFATFAFLNSPSHLAFDPSSGYYYIADDGNNRIRYVNSATRIIFTYAGNGSPFTSGDGGPAVNAVFGSINSVAIDPNRNIYITDALGNSIRRIDAITSTITTVAGGVAGFSGDGGPAAAARLSSPQTLVIDSNSNLYFTDMNNQRVRRIDGLTTTMTTLAGTGVAGYNGDSISSAVASLNAPKALARNSEGALYVGDTNNFRIRRLDPRGFITTYAGNGTNQSPNQGQAFSTPIGLVNALTTDSTGQLYMAESRTSALWTFMLSNSTLNALSALSTPAYLGDAGPLSNAYFNNPMGLVIDTCGNLLAADSGNYRLRRSYTVGNPQNPLYVNMTFNYTNYFASTGTTYIGLNGNPLTTFTGASESNQSFTLRDANLANYPLQTSNPVYGNQQPFIEIQQTSTFGYTKLTGTMSVTGVAGQGGLQNLVDSNSGIIMNSGRLLFPYQNNGITIQNPYNDASLRSINYTGSLVSASDPALKEQIRPADLSICYTTLHSMPLRRYSYVEPYISTFRVADRTRLGFLTSEVAPLLPKSISSRKFEYDWAPSSVNTLDTTQIKYIHLGVTKSLIRLVADLEQEISSLTYELRERMAQRNNVH
jgi:sugar lactone lactonase YvrE